MALAFLITILLIEKEAKIKGIPKDKISNLCIVTFIFSILGARIMYVLNNLSYYRQNLLEIFMLHRGGLMFHGGFILGIVIAMTYLKRSKISVLPVMDTIALYLPIGQAIGRIGCLLNGCCFGKESILPWAVKLGVEDITRHPSQIYESLNSIIIFIILRSISKFRSASKDVLRPGNVFSTYLMLYSINRIIVEEFRADLPEIGLGFSLTQWMSVGIFIAGIIIRLVV
jgi:phosphatidylglycerol:prolipoprotein diacylglycerol transferase